MIVAILIKIDYMYSIVVINTPMATNINAFLKMSFEFVS